MGLDTGCRRYKPHRVHIVVSGFKAAKLQSEFETACLYPPPAALDAVYRVAPRLTRQPHLPNLAQVGLRAAVCASGAMSSEAVLL